MDFKDTQAIYLQIANYICDQIQNLVWKSNEKIPSVRELSVSLEVNPNTVLRSYEYLQQQRLIYTKRGMGYFVSPESAQLIYEVRRTEFVEKELPLVVEKMHFLKVDIEEVKRLYGRFELLKA